MSLSGLECLDKDGGGDNEKRRGLIVLFSSSSYWMCEEEGTASVTRESSFGNPPWMWSLFTGEPSDCLCMMKGEEEEKRRKKK